MEHLPLAMSTDYSSPVQVNGYSCRNCTDVSYAKKGVDPAHPKGEPSRISGATDAGQTADAVRLGGRLAGGVVDAGSALSTIKAAGTLLDVCV
ncbi:MAG: hypothetical protein SGJ21_07740 [Alphaproteobacteria bacterium]|nr:hypothetical protein [Alphaproteobacteria bacterium]